MAVLTIRRIEDQVKERIQRQAQRNRRSMEAEVRQILREAMNPKGTAALATEIASLIAKIKKHPELRTALVSQPKKRKARS